jgi:hypothetical protein
MVFNIDYHMKLPVLAAVLVPSLASANPRPLPFTYTTDTLPAGGVEVEQFMDIQPLRAMDPDDATKRTSYLSTAFQEEIEIGLCDRLELGLYFTWIPNTGVPDAAEFPGVGSGLKQRLRYIFAPLGEWPVDVGVYGELTEQSNEVELEGKILLQRRLDRLRIAANISAEYEFNLANERSVTLNPALGATYEVTPTFSLGLDSWLRHDGASDAVGFNGDYQIYAGPAVMMSFGKLWWAVGAYGRLTDTGHTLQPGDAYGRVYVRSMIGYNL